MSLVIPQASISSATQVSTKKLNKRYLIVFIICAKLEKKTHKTCISSKHWFSY